MPSQPTATEARLNNAITCLTGVVETLEVLTDSLKTPFLEPISNTARSLLTIVQTVRKNKNDCTQLIEQTYVLLLAIIALHVKSETGADLSLSQLKHLGKFTETLHKIHTFVEAQQEKSRLKQFFHLGEMSTLLKDCNVRLQQALEVFKIHDANLLKDVVEMQKYTEEKHQEVLKLIEGLSDDNASARASSIDQVFFNTNNSSNSISMLPSEPKIFHGRESELSEILKLFMHNTPRIAILGPGGMGKTSLGRAVLHHPEITTRYEHHRFFVACDSASSKVELAALIGAHLGLKPGKNLTKPIVRYFSSNPGCLLILDNLETLWEPMGSRGDIEDFLSLLTDVVHLALIVTMRGAERPAKVHWTRPCLKPLQPLRQDAAQKMFIDIADDRHDITDIDKVLLLTDNMPLAIDLIAHLVDLEGCPKVLSRWEKERTSVISDGMDRKSNLGLSISLSLTSPRITSRPHAQALLSLLSMLPDGLSNVELLQSKLPIDDILHCKSDLLRTSLAYSDGQKRLKTLVPIREYMQQFHPPEASLVHPLLHYFRELLELHQNYSGTLADSGIVARITSNFSNIQNVLLNGLQFQTQTPATLYCIIHLNIFSRFSGQGLIPLMNQIPDMLPQPRDHRLEVYHIAEVFGSSKYRPVANAKPLLDRALENMSHFNDPDITARFYHMVADYYRDYDVPTALSFIQSGLSLANSTENIDRQSQILRTLAYIKHRMGEYSEAQMHAYEARRLANISAHLWNESGALRAEAMCWQALGNYRHALLLCDRARYLLPLCGMSGGSLDIFVMNTQAELHKSKSDYVEARKIQIQILNNMNTEQEPFDYALALLNIAEIDVSTGAPKDEVQRNIDAAKSIFNTMNSSMGVTICNATLADLTLRDGNMSAAKTLLLTSLHSAWAHAEIREYCLERLGDACCWTTIGWDPSWSTTFLVNSLKSKHKREIYQALRFVGDVFQAEGDQDTAVNLFTVALEGFTQMDIHRSRAECMLRIGDIAKDEGDELKAVDLWKAARPLFERSSQTKQAAMVDEKLGKIPQDVLDEYQRKLALLSKIDAPTTALDEFDIRSTEEGSLYIDEKENLGRDERQPDPGAL